VKESIIIDTGTWIKLDTLLKMDKIDQKFIDSLYTFFKIIITPEIEDELVYFQLKSWNKKRTYCIPIEDKKLMEIALADGFDNADASIFGLKERNNSIILTEDRPLHPYGKMHGLNFKFFIEFLQVLFSEELIERRELYHLNKILYEIRNINKKTYKIIKKNLQSSQ
jgi:hypothetical protein